MARLRATGMSQAEGCSREWATFPWRGKGYPGPRPRPAPGGQARKSSDSSVLAFSSLRHQVLLLPADVTEHVRMDVQADIGHVVEVLTGNKPDDLADLAFGVIAGDVRKAVRVNLFVLCQRRHIVQSCALRIGKKSARAVLLQGIELGFIHRRFDRERPANIYAEPTDVDTRHLLTNEQGSLWRQQQLFIQLANLRIEQTECKRQPRGMHFQRS